MRATSKLLALALAAVLQPAIAAPAPIVLDFEDITTKVDADGVVDLKIPRYAGVEFKDAAWGLTSSTCDSEAVSNFFTRPANPATGDAGGGCSGLLLASARSGSSIERQFATINLTDGFVTGSSLWYSATTDSTINVTVYEGLDGSGRRMVYEDLEKSNCNGATFCDWSELKLSFDFTAKSIVISGADRSVMLDDISFQPFSTQPAPLPEPGGIALALAALGALGWARKRAAR
ncbi:hypothetical protein [Roseateles sp. LYH14W]|uniref:PEP-CTERM sorting domain-containing protein n=1 Tax=Pelomonas parva TaxID=3299032 RepID=A0ABW7FB74_9BURK